MTNLRQVTNQHPSLYFRTSGSQSPHSLQESEQAGLLLTRPDPELETRSVDFAQEVADEAYGERLREARELQLQEVGLVAPVPVLDLHPLAAEAEHTGFGGLTLAQLDVESATQGAHERPWPIQPNQNPGRQQANRDEPPQIHGSSPMGCVSGTSRNVEILKKDVKIRSETCFPNSVLTLANYSPLVY